MNDDLEHYMIATSRLRSENTALKDEIDSLREERDNLMDGVAFMQELINEKDAALKALQHG